jgi:hypothetical protein
VSDDNDEHSEKQESGKWLISFVNSSVSIDLFKILSFPLTILKSCKDNEFPIE